MSTSQYKAAIQRCGEMLQERFDSRNGGFGGQVQGCPLLCSSACTAIRPPLAAPAQEPGCPLCLLVVLAYLLLLPVIASIICRLRSCRDA